MEKVYQILVFNMVQFPYYLFVLISSCSNSQGSGGGERTEFNQNFKPLMLLHRSNEVVSYYIT